MKRFNKKMISGVKITLFQNDDEMKLSKEEYLNTSILFEYNRLSCILFSLMF